MTWKPHIDAHFSSFILFRELPYDSRAFAPVIKAVVNPQILVVNPGTGIRTFAEYLARAKAKPDSISLGLPGNGGIAHVAHKIITQETWAKVNYIPYPRGGPATLDVLGQPHQCHADHAGRVQALHDAMLEVIRAKPPQHWPSPWRSIPNSPATRQDDGGLDQRAGRAGTRQTWQRGKQPILRMSDVMRSGPASYGCRQARPTGGAGSRA